MAMTRILVVDDDDGIRELLTMVLRHHRFDVDVAANTLDARNLITKIAPDLIVLDVMLPDGDGIEFCQRLRAIGIRTPVLFLTARTTTEDKVRGLTVGGDDYLTKPFSLEEFVARVHALLRRAGIEDATSNVVSYADVELDDDSHDVRRNGVIIEFSPTEFKLLRFLLINSGRVVSKSQILDHVWDYGFDGDSRVVETYISYLRKKLDPHGPPLIQTVRGIGYRMRAD